MSTGRNRRFPLNRVVLLYAIISYLLKKDQINENQFSRRLRIVNNLVRNSEDEISDSELRTSGNRLPAILKQVDSIIINGVVDSSIDRNFNAAQIDEEIAKISWVEEHPEQAEKLYELEDHELLFGQVGIIGLDHIDYADRFKSLFKCNLDLIDAALMSLGNYSQRERNNWRYQFGTSNTRVLRAWQDLFHRSANYEYARTKKTLRKLLVKAEEFSNDLLKELITSFLTEREESQLYDIRYYYVKYGSFRPGSYGKYYWKSFNTNPYKLFVMKTRQQVSQNSYQPFLYEADHSEVLSRDDMGEKIIQGDQYIVCENDAYVVKRLDNNEEIDRLPVTQNEDGIDTEDRILKFREFYQNRCKSAE